MRKRLERHWRRFLGGLLGALIFTGLITILITTLQAQNTGLEDKTLWDWMELLIVPFVLATGALWFNYSQKKVELRIAKEERESEQNIAKERQRQESLEFYFDRMTDLLLNHGLRTKGEEEGAEERSIARARTLSVLRSLDSVGRGNVVRFLYEAGLIALTGETGEGLPIVSLRGANLEGSYLCDADLSGADLSETRMFDAILTHSNFSNANFSKTLLTRAELAFTDLSGANLSRAILIGAYLGGAKLQNANLENAKLPGAELGGVDFTGANLRGADFFEADYDQDTQWPIGFDPIAAGAKPYNSLPTDAI